MNLTYSRDCTCPEIARAEAAGGDSQEYIQAVAQDVWSLGYLLLHLLTDSIYFTKRNSSPGQEWHDLVSLHNDWVGQWTEALPLLLPQHLSVFQNWLQSARIVFL